MFATKNLAKSDKGRRFAEWYEKGVCFAERYEKDVRFADRYEKGVRFAERYEKGVRFAEWYEKVGNIGELAGAFRLDVGRRGPRFVATENGITHLGRMDAQFEEPLLRDMNIRSRSELQTSMEIPEKTIESEEKRSVRGAAAAGYEYPQPLRASDEHGDP